MPGADAKLVSRGALRKRKLRHGFKAEAKRRAVATRRAHGFGDHDAVDCRALAQRLGILIYDLSDIPCDGARYLAGVEPEVFSAATLRHEETIGILINDSHAPERQASNLAHELAHVILEHQDAPPLSDSGCREVDADIEAEAEYLSSVLLVTDDAVMRLARSGVAVDAAAVQFAVSPQMMQWRWNDAGATRRLQRERNRP